MHSDIIVGDPAQVVQGAETLMFIGRRDHLLADEVIPWIPEPLKEGWTSFVDAIKPGDQGGSNTAWLGRSDVGRVVVGVLPEACSRHNSPARPHAFADLVRKQANRDGKLAILACLDGASDALATANAVAQALPLYSRKTSDQDKKQSTALGFVLDDHTDIDHHRLEVIAREVRFAASLVDTPAAELDSEVFVELARETAVQLGVEIAVLEGESLAHAGLGGIWGVGKAANRSPALVVLDYRPSGDQASVKTMAWVGKGIVYDTGGLSIKTKNGMPGMKTDMGGAAAVLAAFKATVELGSPHRILALLCLAENAVGPDSVRPDDILTMYSGRTVEVNNTDAEGRLVLADGVAYVTRHHNPDVVIDLATLTGAQMVATGQRHAGIVCNDDALESLATQVGRETGDLVHPLPYCPEFFRKEFRSVVADMKNSVKDRLNAQSSCAAQFVAEHLVDYEEAWLHVDLAGPSGHSERATGFGTTFLVELASRFGVS